MTKEERPTHRRNRTFHLQCGEITFFVTVGEWHGKPMELFIDIGKNGSDMKTLYNAIGRLVSTGWQHGASLLSTIDQFKDVQTFFPKKLGQGHISIEGLPVASILDAIGLVLESEYT